VICGESGAGKTESAKIVLRYLCARSAGSNDMDKRLLATNPVMEAFGNAKTVRNNNSSRFGKLLKLQYNKANQIAGGRFEVYLLEKSRVTLPPTGERNFHAFYHLVAGVGATGDRELQVVKEHQLDYLVKSNCAVAEGIDDEAQFQELCQGMSDSGISLEHQRKLWHVLSGVLLLGNVEFINEETAAGDTAIVAPGKNTFTLLAAKFLGVAEEALMALLTEKSRTTRGETIVSKLCADEASNIRDTVAKEVYQQVFDVLLICMNNSLKGVDVETAGQPFIGVLDIFGFESFASNDIEQLLINYANEMLQSSFNRHVFQNEMSLYQQEGISMEPVTYPDNDECVRLISGPSDGILKVLQDECASVRPSDKKFVQTLHKTHVRNPFYPKPHPKDADRQFNVRHFAGVVTYTVGNFIEKNNSSVPASLESFLASSHLAALPGSELGAVQAKGKGKGNAPKRKAKSVASVFQTQMANLLTVLSNARCSFIRCVKPNATNTFGTFDHAYTESQMAAQGMVQTCDVLKVGLPTRVPYAQVASSFRPQLPKALQKILANESDKNLCVGILWAFEVPPESYKCGLTRLFFRTGQMAQLSKIMDVDWAEKGDWLAARLRRFVQRKRWKRALAMLIAQQRFTLLLQHVQEEHRKELERIVMVQGRIRACAARARFNVLMEAELERRRIEMEAAEAARKAAEEAERIAKEEAEKAAEAARLAAAEAARLQAELEAVEAARVAAEEEAARQKAEAAAAADKQAKKDAKAAQKKAEEDLKLKRKQAAEAAAAATAFAAEEKRVQDESEALEARCQAAAELVSKAQTVEAEANAAHEEAEDERKLARAAATGRATALTKRVSLALAVKVTAKESARNAAHNHFLGKKKKRYGAVDHYKQVRRGTLHGEMADAEPEVEQLGTFTPEYCRLIIDALRVTNISINDETTSGNLKAIAHFFGQRPPHNVHCKVNAELRTRRRNRITAGRSTMVDHCTVARAVDRHRQSVVAQSTRAGHMIKANKLLHYGLLDEETNTRLIHAIFAGKEGAAWPEAFPCDDAALATVEVAAVQAAGLVVSEGAADAPPSGKKRRSSLTGSRKASANRASVYHAPDGLSGVLQKRSTGIASRWQSRFFEISGHYLNIYKVTGKGGAEKREGEPRVLDLYHLQTLNLENEKEIALSLKAGTELGDDGEPEAVMRLKAGSEQEAEQWGAALLARQPVSKRRGSSAIDVACRDKRELDELEVVGEDETAAGGAQDAEGAAAALLSVQEAEERPFDVAQLACGQCGLLNSTLQGRKCTACKEYLVPPCVPKLIVDGASSTRPEKPVPPLNSGALPKTAATAAYRGGALVCEGWAHGFSMHDGVGVSTLTILCSWEHRSQACAGSSQVFWALEKSHAEFNELRERLVQEATAAGSEATNVPALADASCALSQKAQDTENAAAVMQFLGRLLQEVQGWHSLGIGLGEGGALNRFLRVGTHAEALLRKAVVASEEEAAGEDAAAALHGYVPLDEDELAIVSRAVEQLNRMVEHVSRGAAQSHDAVASGDPRNDADLQGLIRTVLSYEMRLKVPPNSIHSVLRNDFAK
jgi:hypothetical protein